MPKSPSSDGRGSKPEKGRARRSSPRPHLPASRKNRTHPESTAASEPLSPAGLRSPLPAFARHETFHPRHGWVKKGFDAASKDPNVFARDNAPLVLGVGKNMVRSIRYWCTALKVLEPSTRLPDEGGLGPTVLGMRLLDDHRGYDPYLEDPGSLWLLHWNLLQPPCLASAWYYAFNVYPQLDFTIDDLVASMSDWVDREFRQSRVVVGSLRKDASCIARMYGDVPTVGEVSEESIHCPFAELGLLRALPAQSRAYSFALGAKPGLSSKLVTSASLQFAATVAGSARSVSVSRLLRSPGSPGMVFKLSESALYDALEREAVDDSRLRLSDTAGALQFSFTDEPGRLALEFLEGHFKNRHRMKARA